MPTGTTFDRQMLKMIADDSSSMLDLHRHAGIAEAAHVRPLNAGTSFAIWLNSPSMRHKTVLAGDIVNEVVQKFPFGARIAAVLRRPS